VSGNEPYFGSRNPDIAPSWAGAAPAAPEALEMQTGSVPFIFTIIHGIYFTKKGHPVNYEFRIENLELRNTGRFICAIRACGP
jgi:hypothetical protein